MQKLFIILACVFFAWTAHAQELQVDNQDTLHAKVNAILNEEVITNYDGTKNDIQTLDVTLMNGAHEGTHVTVKNDYKKVSVGQTIFVGHFVDMNGVETYTLMDIDRRPAMYFLLGIFIFIVVLFGRWQGVRSLLALALSFAALVYVLIPLLLAGYSPIITGSTVASVILFAAIFLTYGFTPTATIAFIGTTIAVILTGCFAWFATILTHLSGVANEESAYLQVGATMQYDMIGLLIAGIIIGSLGVLDDIAVTQVAVVKELLHANKKFSFSELYTRAIGIGQSHVSALVNTLVLAYTGASLPLLLLFSQTLKNGGSYFAPVLNMEVFATEIVRMIVGSAGLVLAVPITTILAVWYFKRYPDAVHSNDCGHGHHHH